jgi:hypothetical protein
MKYLLLPLIIFGVALTAGGLLTPQPLVVTEIVVTVPPLLSDVVEGPPLYAMGDTFEGPPDPALLHWQEFLGTEAGQVAYELAGTYEIPHWVAQRLIWRESKGNTNLISPTNDHGLMQLNAGTWPWLARRVGLENPDLYNPRDNLTMGFWYLDYLHGKYPDWDETLTAYNRGEGGLRDYIASRGTPRSSYSDFILRGGS